MTLLVCGAAEDGALWDDVIAALPDARVLVLPPTDRLQELTEAVRRAASPRELLVGHSLGGAVSVLAAAATGREQIAGLIVVACGASLPVHPAVWATLHESGEAAVADRLARLQPPDVGERMGTMMRRARPGTLERHLRACGAFRAPAVAVPSVVVAGEADRVVAPPLSAQLAERLGARLVLLPGIGHQVPWEAPQAVLEAVAALL
jgi:pimeloyl-ACP methyl ester carboxylesterase